MSCGLSLGGASERVMIEAFSSFSISDPNSALAVCDNNSFTVSAYEILNSIQYIEPTFHETMRKFCKFLLLEIGTKITSVILFDCLIKWYYWKITIYTILRFLGAIALFFVYTPWCFDLFLYRFFALFWIFTNLFVKSGSQLLYFS